MMSLSGQAPQQNIDKEQHVTVIGAGIIGISCAVQLQAKGLKVSVIDKLPPADATSHGNAGIFAECGCIPVATPGFIWQLPQLLLDPHGPLSLPLSYLPKFSGWGTSFALNTRMKRFRHISQSLATLLKDATALHLQQAELTGTQKFAKASPYYYLYQDEAAFNGDKLAWSTRRQYGSQYDLLEGEAVHQREPAVSDAFNFAVSLHNHGYSPNPGGLVKKMAQHFVEQGGEFITGEVVELRRERSSANGLVQDKAQQKVPGQDRSQEQSLKQGFEQDLEQNRVSHIVTDRGIYPVGQLVLAGGAWSAKLAEQLGHKVPLEAERGYHVEVKNPGITLNAPIMFSAGKLVATPMEEGIRFAGLVEFGGLKADPDYDFCDRLLYHAKVLFPQIDTTDHVKWMGHRPSITDSLPVIGRCPNYSNVLYAFGHQHMGLGLGPRTGRIITELVTTGQSEIDLTPYRIDRF